MRLFPLIAVCALAACMPAQEAQVTKNYTDPGPAGVAFPAMQGFGAVASSAAARPNADGALAVAAVSDGDQHRLVFLELARDRP